MPRLTADAPARPDTAPDPALLLPDATAMDAVVLHVADVDGIAAYYREALGLVDLAPGAAATATDRAVPAADGLPGARPATVVLGRAGTPLVVLVHTPGLPGPRRGEAGLFHTALLFPDRAALAEVVLRAARHPRSVFVGSSDHLVSQAFYFTDPEGNGIELYWDRPRDEWPRVDGRIQIDTLPLDPGRFLREHGGVAGAASADVGHVHLKVGDVPTARAFYADALGFEVVLDMGSALFVSAGGYHHHMAMNTWESRGAGARAATIGLGQVSITVPSRDDVAALAARLRSRGIAHADDGRSLRVEDPWRSLLEVRAVEAA